MQSGAACSIPKNGLGIGYHPLVLARTTRLLTAALVVLIGSSATPAPARPPSCLPDFRPDPARAARITRDLGALPDAATLLEAARSRRSLGFCFGPIERSVVTDEGTLHLDAALPPGADTARAAHLLAHVVEFPDLDAPTGPPCTSVVARALDAEAHAMAIETRLRAHAALPPRYDFERSCETASTPEGCERVIRAYLDANPDGAPGVDPLMRQYTERCEHARR